MADYKNHRQSWSTEEDQILLQAVITEIENGGTQRDAFKIVSEKIGRTILAIEFHWKKIRKENGIIMEQFQGALAYALADAINSPQNPQDYPQESELIQEITKGAKHLHLMVKQIVEHIDQDGDGAQAQKIRTMYQALNAIRPNERGYMMARGMIVMMYHMIDIMGGDAEGMILPQLE